MIRLLLVFIFLLIQVKTHAQFFDNNFFYMDAGISVGNYGGVHLSLNHVHKEKHSIHIGISSLIKLNSPYNSFFKGLEGIISHEVLYGRVIKLSRDSRISIRGGGALCNNYISTTLNSTDHSKAYLYEEERRLGYIFKPELEFPFSKVAGISFAPFVMYNPLNTAFGVEGKIMLGHLRRKN